MNLAQSTFNVVANGPTTYQILQNPVALHFCQYMSIQARDVDKWTEYKTYSPSAKTQKKGTCLLESRLKHHKHR